MTDDFNVDETDFDPLVARFIQPLAEMAVPEPPEAAPSKTWVVERPSRRFVLPASVAAAVVLVVGVGAFAFFNRDTETDLEVSNADSATSTSAPVLPPVTEMVYFKTASDQGVQPDTGEPNGDVIEVKPASLATVAIRGKVLAVWDTPMDVTADGGVLGAFGASYYYLRIEVAETYRSNLKPGDEVIFATIKDLGEKVFPGIHQQIKPIVGDDVFVQTEVAWWEGDELLLASSELTAVHNLGVISSTGLGDSIEATFTNGLPLSSLVEAFTSRGSEFESDRNCDVSNQTLKIPSETVIHAFITDVDLNAGRYGSVTFDQFEWADSDEFDYEIINDDDALETAEISMGAITWLTRLSTDGTAAHSADDGSLTDLGELVASPGGQSTPFTLMVDDDQITEICQVYVP